MQKRLAALAFFLMIAVVVVAWAIEARVARTFDAALAARAELLAAAAREGEGAMGTAIGANYESTAFFQLWREGGGVLARSPSLANADLDLPYAHEDWRGPMASVVRDTLLPDGRPGRLAVFGFPGDALVGDAAQEDGAQRLFVAVAVDRTPLDQRIKAIAVLTPLFAALMFVAVAWVLRESTRDGRPALAKIETDRQARARVAIEDPAIEVDEVTRQLNLLAERRETVMAKLRQHGDRSPDVGAARRPETSDGGA